MYFNGIGRITDYVKTVQIEQKWQQKKIDVSAANSRDNSSVSSFLKANSDRLKAKALEDVKNKMKSGRRLSHDEKEFLRIHAPDLYEKAIKIEKERDEFRRALSNCKTKEDAWRVHSLKTLELQVKGQDVEFVAMRMMAILDEFADFIKSEEYEDIPSEYENNDEESGEESEEIENSGKNGKSKFKKAKLTLKEEMALNVYKSSDGKILNRVNFFEPAKPTPSFTANP
jgi:hypothetical protein